MAKCRELLNKGLLQDIFREQMWALSEVREKVYNFQKLPLDKSHFITEVTDYKKANAEFERLLQALILEIGKFDSSILHNNPKDLTFKIVRDTRFSHDKSPYNPAFCAHISPKGKLPVPAGYKKEHPQVEYLKYKRWYLEYPLKDTELSDAEAFLVKAAEIFQIMKPFNDYLNRALVGFQMPAR